MTIELLYADRWLVAVNKPPDLLSVPGKGPQGSHCLLNLVAAEYPDVQIVHRLDCATSGVMVLARDADTHRRLSRMFHDRQVCKVYQALVAPRLPASSGRIALPLRCDWPNRPRQRVDLRQGKEAITEWRVTERLDNCWRVELRPVTGRSHQLRVHMLALGAPVLGDRFYAGPVTQGAASRLCLHAERLTLPHPHSGEPLSLAAPVPF